jgi:uncharacterized protein YjiS (DUF1127 family)
MSIDQTDKLVSPTVLPGIPSRLGIKHWVKLLLLRAEVKRERRMLAKLPDTLLADMGIDRADALRESRRSWRDVPPQCVQHQLGRYWLINLD